MFIVAHLQYARPQILAFMFRHGHYTDACLLFFPLNAIPSPPQPASHGAATPTQRPDLLATDYGTIDDLCDFCVGYGAMSVLGDIISERKASSASQDATVIQYTNAALGRICNYCETHRHFNYLYKFQVWSSLLNPMIVVSILEFILYHLSSFLVFFKQDWACYILISYQSLASYVGMPCHVLSPALI